MFEKLLQLIVPVAMKFLKGLADDEIDGSTLSPFKLIIVWNARNIVGTFGKFYAAETDNTYDDDAVAEIVDLGNDTLAEAGITNSPIPEFGEIVPEE